MRINFNKSKFLNEFSKLASDPEKDWFYIIENHGDLSVEENLARLVWKGIDAQTKEYYEYVDSVLGDD